MIFNKYVVIFYFIQGFLKSKLHEDHGANIRLTDLVMDLGNHFPPKKFIKLKRLLMSKVFFLTSV